MQNVEEKWKRQNQHKKGAHGMNGKKDVKGKKRFDIEREKKTGLKKLTKMNWLKQNVTENEEIFKSARKDVKKIRR